MILRRIREHVGAHNWFAVAVDFVIVVVGVFVGIEVSNWNEARQNRAEEVRYYRQIREDLVTDLATLQRARVRSSHNDRAAELALASLSSGPPPGRPTGAVAASFHRAGFLYLPMASRGTYDELISTGNLGLLRDEALQDRILEYYSAFQETRQWDPLLREQQKDYWSELAGVLPRHVLQASIRGRIPEVSEAELGAILAEARSRERLRDLLIGMAAHQERVRRDSEATARRARAVIAQLDRRLGEGR